MPLNEIQVIQAGLMHVREVEHCRRINKLYIQRLEDDHWGMHIEGVNKQGDTLTVKMRIEEPGTVYRLPAD